MEHTPYHLMLTFPFEELQAAMESYSGFCVACGASRGCCEPDARNYPCDECGEDEVYGAEELVIMGLAETD